MLGYFAASQGALVGLAGIDEGQLKTVLEARGEGPSTEFLRDLAAALGLPEEFAKDGWRAFEGWEANEAHAKATALPARRRRSDGRRQAAAGAQAAGQRRSASQSKPRRDRA